MLLHAFKMTDSEEKTEEKPKLPTRASSELLSVKGGKELNFVTFYGSLVVVVVSAEFA